MKFYSKEELDQGIKTMESLIRKSEKAKQSLTPGTSQHTTITRRLDAFCLALEILQEKRQEQGD